MPDETLSESEFDPEATEPVPGVGDVEADPEATLNAEPTEKLAESAVEATEVDPALQPGAESQTADGDSKTARLGSTTTEESDDPDETLPDDTEPDATIVQEEFSDQVVTMIEAAGIDLDATHGEESLKLPSTTGQSSGSGTAGSTGTSSSGATRSSVASVVVCPRDVTYGHATQIIAEYEIGEMLGQGGMGSVYRAKQNSIGRSVALKMLRAGTESVSTNNKFLTEAVITGELEHPNIVPIYDLGANAGGDLFYAMKEVRGAPWRKTIDTASEDDNLEVLHKVADAIAFSHSRGVVHRDLKPDNVMIGEFGEVLVMDWGLALPVGEFTKQGLALSHGPCGTPAYMAPEMAEPNGKVSFASDVYLLGAMLYRVATGKAPHTAKTARLCLESAMRNDIVEAEGNEELLTIARKAMATDPEDRHRSAQEFQEELRSYREFKELRAMTRRAVEEMQNGLADADAGRTGYRSFERALAGLEEVLIVWPQNEEAQEYRLATQLAYAKSAFARGDFDLASQQLDRTHEEHATLLAEIQTAKDEHDSRLARLQQAKRIATGLAASIFVVISIASYLLYDSWQSEKKAHTIARQQFHEAHLAIDRLAGISDDLQYFPRLTTVRTNLLRMVADYYDELADVGSDGVVEEDLVATLVKLGEVHALLQEHERAITTWRQARDEAAKIDRTGTKSAVQLLVLESFANAAASELARGKPDKAKLAVNGGEEVLARLEKRLEENEVSSPAATLETQAARIEEFRGNFKEAAKAHTSASRKFRLAGTDLGQKNSAAALTMAGQALDLAGDPTGAIDRFEGAIKLWERLLETAPDVPDYLEGLATAHISLANVQRDVGVNAEDTYRDAAKAFDKLIEARPEIPRYQFNRATSMVNLAWLLNQSAPGRKGLADEAQQLAVGATNEYVRLASQYPEAAEYPDGEAASRSVLGEILRNRGELQLAAEMFTVAADHYASRMGESTNPPPQYRDLLAVNLSGFAQVMAISGSGEGVPNADSIESLESAVEQWQLALQQISPLVDVLEGRSVPQYLDDAAWIHIHLADVLWRLNKMDEALASARRAAELRSGLTSPQHLHNAAWLRVHSLVPGVRDAKLAVDLASQATKKAPSNPDYQNTLAAAWLAAGNVKEAEAALALAGKNRKAPSPADQLVRSMIEREKKNTEKADELLAAAIKLADETAPLNPKLLRLRLEAKVASQSPAE